MTSQQDWHPDRASIICSTIERNLFKKVKITKPYGSKPKLTKIKGVYSIKILKDYFGKKSL